ncbi:MAG: PHP domain-containing protein [Oscillospiraceae bacterium]|nr:PHP domain-containing protein [Oscillospiraceae bacterium]
MKMYANLHTHSTHSDGGYSPEKLVLAAKKEGYGAIALTDHDTITGYEKLKTECEKQGMECIFGAEFTAPSKLLYEKFGNRAGLHIVGFHFDPEYPPMKKYLEEMSLRETDQTRVLFERSVRLGKIRGIEWEEVLEYNKGIMWLCNEHLFRALKAKGLMTQADHGWYFKELFGKHRHEVTPLYEFKQDYEIIKLIRDAGGIAIIAHPHEQLQYMEAWIEMGAEGLEAWNALTEEEQAEAHKMALEKGLYISGGSDHTGQCSGYYELFSEPSECPKYAPDLVAGTTRQYFEEIKNRKINR